MEGLGQRRDLDGFVGTEKSTFVNQSGGFPPMSDFTSQDAGGFPITSGGGGMVPQAFTSGGVGGLLDALAGSDAGSGGGGGGISDFLDSLADPNDISSGEFGGVDSLLDDLAGSAVGPTIPVMSGGGDGMPPPPPPMSGDGDGMPPPITRRGRRPSVRQRGATRVRSPFPNGSRQALATRAFRGR